MRYITKMRVIANIMFVGAGACAAIGFYSALHGDVAYGTGLIICGVLLPGVFPWPLEAPKRRILDCVDWARDIDQEPVADELLALYAKQGGMVTTDQLLRFQRKLRGRGPAPLDIDAHRRLEKLSGRQAK